MKRVCFKLKFVENRKNPPIYRSAIYMPRKTKVSLLYNNEKKSFSPNLHLIQLTTLNLSECGFMYVRKAGGLVPSKFDSLSKTKMCIIIM